MWFIILGLGAAGVGYAVAKKRADEECARRLAAAQAQAQADQAAALEGERNSRHPRALMGAQLRSRGHYGRYDGSGNYRRN